MLKNGLYNVGGAVIRMLLSLLTIPFLIRIIGVEEYGLWTLVAAVVSIVTLAEAGLSLSTTVFVSRDLAVDNAEGIMQTLTIAFGGMLVLASLAAIGLWLSASSVVLFFPDLTQAQQQVAIQAFRLGGLVVWSRLLQQVAVGLEQAYQRYGIMNFFNTLQAALISLGIILIAWLGGRVVAMMQWQIFVSVIILALHLYFVWRLISQLNVRLVWNHTRSREMLTYSGMTWVTSLGSILFGQFDRVIVGAFLGTTGLGIYAAITSITVQINSLSALPVQPLIPDLVAAYKNPCENQLSISAKIKRATEINAAVSLGLGAVLFILAPLVAKFIGIDSSNNGLLRTAVLIYTLYSLNAVGYFILFSIKAVEMNLIIVLISGIFSISLIALGAKFAGLSGAIWGNSGYILTLILNFVSLYKLNISLQKWIVWLSFPLLWFIVVCGISWGMANFVQRLPEQAFFLGLALCGLCAWLVLTQGFDLKQLYQRMQKLT